MSYYDNTNKKRIRHSRSIKKALLERNKSKCHWCKREIFMAPPNITYTGEKPWNIATLDHVYHRWDIRRAIKRHDVVISCHECNKKRSKEFQEQLFKDYPKDIELDIFSFLREPDLV